MTIQTSHTTPSLDVLDFNLAFGPRCIFNAFSLTIPIGSWTCLLGSSGVGKSCLLRFIAGLLTHKELKTSGQCCYHQRPIVHGEVSYLAQQDGLLPWLTVLDNALLGVRLRSLPLDSHTRTKAIELLKQVGLAHCLAQRPASLSGGMRQRVALVRALLEDTPIVLMDEPFSGLDAITRANMQTLAATLLKNKTVLLVTHDPLEALRLGNQISVLSGCPATLSTPITPEGATPRALDDSAILALQGQLLKALSDAH